MAGFIKSIGEKLEAETRLESASVFTAPAPKEEEAPAPQAESVTEPVTEPVVEAVQQKEQEPDGLEDLGAMEDLGAEPTPPPTTESTPAPVAEPVTEAQPVAQAEPVVEEQPQPALGTQPSVTDTTAFKQLTRNNEEVGPEVAGSYAEVVESMVSQQCQLHGIKNLDLTTFGLRAQVISFPNLSTMTFGNHKFLGAPFTPKEEDLIIHRLAVHMATTDKERVVVRAVQEIKDERGLSYYSLLFTESIARRFADMFEYKVFANVNEADVSKLVLVIQK